MAINISQAFKRTSANPVDESLTLTKAQMLTVNDNLMPSKYFTICQDDGKLYLYDKTNTADPTTGKFRVFEGGGSSDYDDLDNKPSINGVELIGDKTASDFDLDKAVELTQAEYSALSEEEKMNGTTYFLTDGEGGSDFSIKKRVLNAGATTVSLPCPTTGDYITRIYTSDGRDYLGVSVSEGTLTITFEAPSTNVDVFVEFRGV